MPVTQGKGSLTWQIQKYTNRYARHLGEDHSMISCCIRYLAGNLEKYQQKMQTKDPSADLETDQWKPMLHSSCQDVWTKQTKVDVLTKLYPLVLSRSDPAFLLSIVGSLYSFECQILVWSLEIALMGSGVAFNFSIRW